MVADMASLIVFIGIIGTAFWRKNNIGILALSAGVVLVNAVGMPEKVLIGGISASLFITLVGITLLFSIVIDTGALDLLARKVIATAGERMWVLPILIFIAGFIVVSVGPGGVPALAIIPPLAASIAVRVGFHPIMLILIGICGMTAGRFSPITPESAIVAEAVMKAGLNGSDIIPALMVSVAFANFLAALVLYVIYGGYKLKRPLQKLETDVEAFSTRQIVSLSGIVTMLVLVVCFHVTLGLAALLVSGVLLFCHVAEDSTVVKMIPWSTIVMVLGVGALLSVVNKLGGIELMNDFMASVMTESTAIPAMGISAGLLSFVSSALGVVYPTMMPMCVDIARQIGNVNPVAMMSAVAVGGAVSGMSPASTGGALILAAVAGSYKEKYTKEVEGKYFLELLIVAAAGLVLFVTVAALTFNFIADMMCP